MIISMNLFSKLKVNCYY